MSDFDEHLLIKNQLNTPENISLFDSALQGECCCVSFSCLMLVTCAHPKHCESSTRLFGVRVSCLCI